MSAVQNSVKSLRRLPRHVLIVICLIVGGLLGIGANLQWSRPLIDGVAHVSDSNKNGLADTLDYILAVSEPVGKIFLRLMFMVVVPLVFSALALAVVEMGDLRQLGRIGAKTLLFTGIFSTAAVVLGVVLVDALRPGEGLPPERRESLRRQYATEATQKSEQAAKAKPLGQTLIDIIPENPLQEMVGAIDGSSKGNGMLAVMFFALIFGLGCSLNPEKCETLIKGLEGLYAIAMTVIGWAMVLAPLGAGCLVFSLTARLGLDIVFTLLKFVVTTLLGLGTHLLVVYPIVILLAGGMNPLRFFRNVSEAMLVAFGTSSSSATLPTAVRVAQESLKLPPRISNFVLTVGATGNQNGTALYEGVVVLFLAQVFGVELTVGQQVQVVLMSVLAGIGTAGVPGGSLPLIAALCQSVNVPGDGIGIILGVDRILDMCRTVLNVTGDLAVATCVAHSEPAETPHPR